MANDNIKTFWNGEKVIKKMNISKIKSVLQGALALQAQAVYLAPVDTALLKGSITVKTNKQTILSGEGRHGDGTNIIEPKDENTAHVGTALDYAQYQEFGTAKMQAQPFMRPSLDILKGKVLDIFKKNGKIELEKYFK